jgi:hypothetical protein
MRIAVVAAFICTAALSAQAGYVVELETGETFAVESFWREGTKVHLMRGGMDMIVEGSRIRRLEEGGEIEAMPPSQPAPRRREAAVEEAPDAAPATAPSDWTPPEAYREATRASDDDERPIQEWTLDELEAEDRRASKRLLRAQQERSEAKFRDISGSQRERIEERFWRNKKLERTVDKQLKRRVAEMNGETP